MGLKKNLEESFDYDIVDEFMDHYDIICEELEPIILRLDDKENYDECVNELFRIFHNLKSATGYLHLNVINNLAKFTEDELEIARAIDGPANSAFIDWLLAISDQLRSWLYDIRLDHDDYTPLNGQIIKIPKNLEEK